MCHSISCPLLALDILGDSSIVPAGWVPLDLLFFSLLMMPVFLTCILSFFLENTVSGKGLPKVLCRSTEGWTWPWDCPSTTGSVCWQLC